MLYTPNEKGHIVPLEGIVPSHVLQREFVLAQDMGNAREGERVLMAVTPADTSQSVELETYLGGYSQFGMGCDLVAPIVPVDTETFKRRDFSLLNVFAPVEDRVGRAGAINQIEHASAVVESKCEEHALAAFIPYAAENDAVRSYNVRAAHSDMIRDKLNLNEEIRVWDKLTTTSNWSASHYATITTNYKWPAGSTKNPLGDLQTRIQASYTPVTDIFMNTEVAGYMLKDSGIMAYANLWLGTAGLKDASAAAAAAASQGIQRFVLPGFPPITVLSGKKYVSSAMSQILTDSVVLANVPGPEMLRGGDTMGTILRFRYRGRSGTGWTVNEYVPYGRGINGGTMIEVGFNEALVMPCNTAGGLIDNVI